MEQEQVFDKRRLWVRCLIVGVLFAVIIVFFSGKLVSAQLSPEALAASAEKYTYTEVPIKAVRGEIYSSNGTPLVVNKSSYSLKMGIVAFIILKIFKKSHFFLYIKIPCVQILLL